MSEFSKIEVNAAIERLIVCSGSDAAAREILAAYAASIKSDSTASVDISAQSGGGSVSGVTPGGGMVNVGHQSKQDREWKAGEYSRRVGHYKVSRKTTRSLFGRVKEERVVVTGFWKADLTTQSDTQEPESWCLSCDAKMQPMWFGRMESVELIHLGPLSIVVRGYGRLGARAWARCIRTIFT